jgi:hypothetical protein
MQPALKVMFVLAALVLLPATALAQGQIAGTVRDDTGGLIPGVIVEVTSPALIEKVRSVVSDDNGQYRITNLPVGTYTVTFSLEGFTRQQRDNIALTTGFTAPVNVTMTVGQRSETVNVVGEPPTVDVQNARQAITFDGTELRDLPTVGNVRSLLLLTPGLTAAGLGADCVGGAGVWCNNNIYNLNAHVAANDTEGLSQGRIMVDGSIINSGGGAGIMGMTGGYSADVRNAQEVSISISGALGESETGGAAINIVPRTGGNRFAGNFYTSYTRQQWFDKNNGTHTSVAVVNALIDDHDVSGSFGGPILRDRLWFFASGRVWGKEAYNGQGLLIWDNKNAGMWGMNYQPDRSQDPLTFTNMTRNLGARITYQATQRNKFNVFWDEGMTCQDPCDGAVAAWQPREGTWSGQTHPARLQQVSWTNPLTGRILLEAGLSMNRQLYDFSYHRYVVPHREVPRVEEFGVTVGADEVAPQVNSSVGPFATASGALNNGLGGLAEWRDLDDYRWRASASYVTGSHNAKIGYDAALFTQTRHNTVNDTRWTYRYDTPQGPTATNPGCYNAANPPASTCGNTSLYFPEDPYNQARRPVPTRITINTGMGELKNRAQYGALFIQDQWTLKRLTLSGALRFDHASSSYRETCIGPDPYVPIQSGGQYAGQNRYCVAPSDGVSYNDLTPRWGAAWDLFGNGKTSIKYNMGKYLGAAGISGIYADANPAARTVNQIEQLWNDANGDRIPQCDLLNFNPNGECNGPSNAFQDRTRYGRDPFSFAADGITQIGLTTTQCGRREEGIPADVQAYCNVYGDSLIEGWGKRRAEWQLGLGIQHEILPRLSAEVTFNRRQYSNLTVTDQLGIGCDRFNGAQDVRACQDDVLNYTSASYDFFTVQAPLDPNLPGGGGYLVRGLSNPKATLPTGRPSAVTIMQELDYSWNGIDTNFVWRGPRGIRVNGGTSTGRAVRDECYTELDGPNVKAREGNSPACNPNVRYETNVRGSASYTIPWVDVLASTIFQYRPGIAYNANMTVTKDQVTWEPNSAGRATQASTCTGANAGQVGCFVASGGTTQTTTIVNLLDPGDVYGEGYWNFDLKFAKNIRFANKRLNVGVDVYNLFNNDAIRGIQQTYPGSAGGVVWSAPTVLLSPRFARLSVQFDF